MQPQTVIHNIDMMNSLICATVILILGHYIKILIPVLKKFFIPRPVAGGIIFALIIFIAHEYLHYDFNFDVQLKDLTMMMFFTGIGYMASFRILLQGGKDVMLFTLCTVLLIVFQNLVGTGIASLFNENPLLGLAAGSISLVGGHGTSAAFGVELEKAGLAGGLSIAVTCATFGLISGSLIGGPLGRFLIKKHGVVCPGKDGAENESGNDTIVEKHLREDTLGVALIYIFTAIALGNAGMYLMKSLNIVLPAYLGPMVTACIIRNVSDLTGHRIPGHAIATSGNLALQYFLAFALMNLHLWELKSLAVPITVILLAQCLLLVTFVSFITFRVMGRNYNSAVLCCGQCGFGMGATPNALANMSTLTGFYGEEPRAFFVVSIVGSLIIDFVNALVITGFCSALM